MSDVGGSSNLSGQNNTAEPSMEEILASIRRILAEEQGQSKFIAEPEGELLLDSSMRVIAAKVEPSDNPPTSQLASMESAAPSAVQNQESHLHPPSGLVGEQVVEQVARSVGSLLRSISTERSVGISRGGATLEDMVREELRPMLKAWLDTHLPGLVERVVRTEINRLMEIAQG